MIKSATLLSRPLPSCTVSHCTKVLVGCRAQSARFSSSDATLPAEKIPLFPSRSDLKQQEPLALARLPTLNILRSLFLGAFFKSPLLFTPGFAILRRIANSRSRILNPDVNPLLRVIIKPLIYDHFCAGTNKSEIQRSIQQTKGLGFGGIILCYTKEVQIRTPDEPEVEGLGANEVSVDQELAQWKEDCLMTLDMVENGDFMGLKCTGAGNRITEELLQGNDPPPAFVEAMDAILQKAAARNNRVWMDAEQQVLQPTIDRWTIDLMRKYNRNGKAVLYNTLQAYLKASRQKLEYQLSTAHQEGWTLGIKLVRGAYISNDIRERIHDTKPDTDASYNGIVRDLLSGTVNGLPQDDFPKMQLFLAGHNVESVSKASALVRNLQNEGKLKTLPEFGQLQGMADQLGCELLQHGENTARDAAATGQPIAIPKVYKCLHWGSVQECMQYLVRRAVENRGATGGMKEGLPALAAELRRRVVDALMGRSRRLD